jgi:energy-converting hydrogenase B subunit D
VTESLVQAVALIVTAVVATVVVVTREPKRQIFCYMLYGFALTLLFVVLQAPDVALSELAVGSVAIPFAILATLVRIEHGPK